MSAKGNENINSLLQHKLQTATKTQEITARITKNMLKITIMQRIQALLAATVTTELLIRTVH